MPQAIVAEAAIPQGAIRFRVDEKGSLRLLSSLRPYFDLFPHAGDALLNRSEFRERAFHLNTRAARRTGEIVLRLQLSEFGRGFMAALRALKGNYFLVKQARHERPPKDAVGLLTVAQNSRGKKGKINKKNKEKASQTATACCIFRP
ncbi:MAG: hypothetical protein HY651_06885 [Acidobacteria bacterium]|nr:hypothetical protein [Acidobacteriota bacterium]